MDKHQVAKILDDIAMLLEVQGENPFKVRAYHNAARALENIDEDLSLLVAQGRLREIRGIGDHIALKIETLVHTGTLPYYEELKRSMPAGLAGLLSISGLGAKKVRVLAEQLGVSTVEELIAACEQDRVAQLPGFGQRSQAKILENIEKAQAYSLRYLWWTAMAIAQPILDGLKKQKDVVQAEVAGSLRRKMETVGDLDLLAASKKPSAVISWFIAMPEVESVTGKGPTKASVRLRQGIQVDLRVVPPQDFGFALLYFTGSKEHNIALRRRANEIGWSLSEYGMEPLEGEEPKALPPTPRKGADEAYIYKCLGLGFIPPEMRENLGEIEAAAKGKIPRLVEEEDMRGVFHCHTAESDGHATLQEMVKGAQELGWEYIGISDHSKSSFQAHGLDEERLFTQIEAIRKLNASGAFTTYAFAGIECDILADGRMDFDNEVLKQLDFVVASVHQRYKLDEEGMTKRIIRAVENPYVTLLGHVSGRLLLQREPYACNLPKIIDACIANGTIIELNAQPARLDLDWRYWHKAAERGLKCCINPDAHSVSELQFYRMGIAIARKGWLQKKHVVNTLSLREIRKCLKKL